MSAEEKCCSLVCPRRLVVFVFGVISEEFFYFHRMVQFENSITLLLFMVWWIWTFFISRLLIINLKNNLFVFGVAFGPYPRLHRALSVPGALDLSVLEVALSR